MKNALRLFLTFSLFFSALSPGNGQDEKNGDPKDETQKNCYQKYASLFEKRGARHVEDGEHDKIVIVFRQGRVAECFYGKVLVEDNKVTEIHRMFRDSTYEKLNKNFKHEDVPMEIQNGMSKTKVTVENELVTVLFIHHIKPPKKEYMRAPAPDIK